MTFKNLFIRHLFGAQRKLSVVEYTIDGQDAFELADITRRGEVIPIGRYSCLSVNFYQKLVEMDVSPFLRD